MTLIHHIINADIESMLRALRALNYMVIMTCKESEITKRVAVADVDIWRLATSAERHDRVTGCASAGAKTVIVYGSDAAQFDNRDAVLAVLLHEVGHLMPYETKDETLAWDRGFNMATVVTAPMWDVRSTSLETYGLAPTAQEEKVALFNKKKSVVETMNEKHYGKAMCANTPEGVSITNECSACGEMVIGPIHPYHLRSMIRILTQMADAIGIDPDEKDDHRIVKEIFPTDMAELERIKSEFKSMNVEDARKILKEGGETALMEQVNKVFHPTGWKKLFGGKK